MAKPKRRKLPITPSHARSMLEALQKRVLASIRVIMEDPRNRRTPEGDTYKAIVLRANKYYIRGAATPEQIETVYMDTAGNLFVTTSSRGAMRISFGVQSPDDLITILQAITY